MGTVPCRMRDAEFRPGTTARPGLLLGLSPVQQHLDGELFVSVGTVKAHLGSQRPRERPDPGICSRILCEGQRDPDLVVPDGVEHPQVLAHAHEPLGGELIQETLPKGSCLWDQGENQRENPSPSAFLLLLLLVLLAHPQQGFLGFGLVLVAGSLDALAHSLGEQLLLPDLPQVLVGLLALLLQGKQERGNPLGQGASGVSLQWRSGNFPLSLSILALDIPRDLGQPQGSQHLGTLGLDFSFPGSLSLDSSHFPIKDLGFQTPSWSSVESDPESSQNHNPKVRSFPFSR